MYKALYLLQKEVMKVFASIVGIVILILALIWVFQGNDFFLYKVFAPQYEDVRRETFEHSKAYNQGMIQELRAHQIEYIKATPEQQAALGTVILHRYADYDESKLDPDLRNFISELRRNQQSR